MGVQFGDLVEPRKISLDELKGRAVAFDGHNVIYQFLAIIRGQGGEQLMDAQGHVTSHLSGILYRNSNLMEAGVRVVYCFDGRPHEFKRQTLEARHEIRVQAKQKFEKAVEEGDHVAARRWGQQSVVATTNVIVDAKRLLGLMGIPVIQAPSEGEAQAAHMAIKGSVWASSSQDFDSILLGAPRLVRNLSISGRRKLPKKNVYIKVEPEMYEYQKLLVEVGLTREQLIDVGILIGTDYNPDGVKGIGPKTAIKLIKKHGSLEAVIPELPNAEFPHPINEIRELFLRPQVTDDYKLDWGKPDTAGILSYLCGEHNFNREKVLAAIDKMNKGFSSATKGTARLDKWFG
ncbi:TPA: flap endonuclease-1 [Candidatus Bathyarchaeota archaeon]|nr:flap endonuclease-1 [Candidatus Bathyarchaeota archaeon]